MTTAGAKFRAVTVQIKSIVGQFEKNALAASRVVSQLPPVAYPTVMVLPELALTGYKFPDASSIERHSEKKGAGRTFEWAAACAEKHNCIVAAGYPELGENGQRYNSMLVASSAGKLIANYRKTHLYESDELWGCQESPLGFSGGLVDLPGIGKAQLGICMDLNPYKFESPWKAKEFATHIAKESPDVVLISMAWLKDNSSVPLPLYWFDRLSISVEHPFKQSALIANQCGEPYGGESCIFLEDGSMATVGDSAEGYAAVTITRK